MELLPPDPVPHILAIELTDEQVTEQGPRIRGQLIHRLERMWELAAAEMERGELEQRQDPRFMELALRIIDREAKLYRLTDAPKVLAEPEEEEAVVTLRARQQVEQQLRELELKVVTG